jgi:N-dimethylarginine dimethylaminohydrolase
MTRNSPRFLMCRPDHFGVVYSINPWMEPRAWEAQEGVLAAQSRREWMGLHRALTGLGATIEHVPAQPGLPDLVFTANAAVVLDRIALLARFRYPERRAEEQHFEQAFQALRARGVIDTVRRLPEGIVLEGAGDCVFDHTRNLFWLGYGPRSDSTARHAVEDTFGVDVAALELIDPRFYHMDTALCPLTRGEVLYVPTAFSAAGRAAISERVNPEQRIAIMEQDAVQLAANAVCVGDALVMSACSDTLRGLLSERGYTVVTTPLQSFLRSGGSAFCLTLRTDRASAASVRVPEETPIAATR